MVSEMNQRGKGMEGAGGQNGEAQSHGTQSRKELEKSESEVLPRRVELKKKKSKL